MVGIPRGLCEYDQWICWRARERDGKQTKLPISPGTDSFASVSDPETWTDYETAQIAVKNGSVSGLGFVFTETDPFVGVDLDSCRDPDSGSPDGWAKEVVQTLDSYTEISPSRTGYHVLVTGSLPPGGNRSGDIELYEDSRFFTVTGDHVAGTPTDIRDRDTELAKVHADHITESPRESPGAESRGGGLSDAELVARAKNAKNGAKFERLWNGNITGYDSHSEADMALCFILAFWTGQNTTQMDRLFRKSGLYRDKWDDPHYSDGRTYGEQTLAKAVYMTDELYEPNEGTRETATQRDTVEPHSVEERTDSTRNSAPTIAQTRIRDLERTISELETNIGRVKSENEYLYSQLEQTQDRIDRVHDRLTRLETTDNSRSILARLLD